MISRFYGIFLKNFYLVGNLSLSQRFQCVQIVVKTLVRYEFQVCAGLHYPPLVENNDDIGVMDR